MKNVFEEAMHKAARQVPESHQLMICSLKNLKRRVARLQTKIETERGRVYIDYSEHPSRAKMNTWLETLWFLEGVLARRVGSRREQKEGHK